MTTEQELKFLEILKDLLINEGGSFSPFKDEIKSMIIKVMKRIAKDTLGLSEIKIDTSGLKGFSIPEIRTFSPMGAVYK